MGYHRNLSSISYFKCPRCNSKSFGIPRDRKITSHMKKGHRHQYPEDTNTEIIRQRL